MAGDEAENWRCPNGRSGYGFERPAVRSQGRRKERRYQIDPTQRLMPRPARGGAVFLPPGVYLAAELQMRPHVSLTGIPAWDYEHGFGSVIRLADEHARCLLNITGAFGVTIEGVCARWRQARRGRARYLAEQAGLRQAGGHIPHRAVPDRQFQRRRRAAHARLVLLHPPFDDRLQRRRRHFAARLGRVLPRQLALRKPAAPDLPRAKRMPRVLSPAIASNGTAKAF